MKPIKLELFNALSAKETQFQAVNTFINTCGAEEYPDYPPRPLSHTIANLTSFHDFESSDLQLYYVWHKGQVIASLFTYVELEESNQHLMSGYIQVHPAYRRQGIARQLLPKLLEIAKYFKRTLIDSI